MPSVSPFHIKPQCSLDVKKNDITSFVSTPKQPTTVVSSGFPSSNTYGLVRPL
jgi:hypothetical protein